MSDTQIDIISLLMEKIASLTTRIEQLENQMRIKPQQYYYIPKINDEEVIDFSNLNLKEQCYY